MTTIIIVDESMVGERRKWELECLPTGTRTIASGNRFLVQLGGNTQVPVPAR